MEIVAIEDIAYRDGESLQNEANYTFYSYIKAI